MRPWRCTTSPPPDTPVLGFPVAPMLATAGDLPVDDDAWAYEVKWDGYRTLAFLDHGTLRLQSRNLLDVTSRWPELAGLAGSVPPGLTVLDGETVAVEPDTGRPSFGALQRGEGVVRYVAFDVLVLDGHETCSLPYERRRELLRSGLEPAPRWSVPAHRVGGGADLLVAARDHGLEGIIAKRLGSTYQPGRRSAAWRKVKIRHQQEVVIGGYTRGQGSRRATFGALLVGVHDDAVLRFAGAVGTGFDDATLHDLACRLQLLETPEPPFRSPVPAAVRRTAVWVQPVLVAEVAFTEWTADGLLRQASFVGLRDDKSPDEVVREP